MIKIKRVLLFLIIFSLQSISFYAQNDEYILEVKEGFELGSIQTTTNVNQTLTFTMTNTSFAESLNTNSIYEFSRMFPGAETVELQRIYFLRVTQNFSSSTISQQEEVMDLFIVDQSEIIEDDGEQFVLPNDYEDPLFGGRNSTFDLIRAPLAWNITAGSPNVLVGIADVSVSWDHDDMEGQYFDSIFIDSYNGATTPDHGMSSAGMIAAKANNGIFLTGLAYDSKIVYAECKASRPSLLRGLFQLSKYPNIKVINCSWGIPASSSFKNLLDYIMAEVNANDILVVGAAGNYPTGIPWYPGAYDSALLVTTVGHRVAIGENHGLLKPDGTPIWLKSWKDVHRKHPEGSTNNHNDKVDVTAPGHINTFITNNYAVHPQGLRYGITTSGTTPVVSGLAALVRSANPALTALETKDIIKNTADDIYQISYNQEFIGELGAGRINAYRAVLTADCMANPRTDIDLAMQNSNVDYLTEPDFNTEKLWLTDDIWVRNQLDTDLIDVHQNPEYDPVNPNYAYVRVTNNSCVTSSGNDIMKLYWAKANTALTWDFHWKGEFTIENPPGTGNFVKMGDEIGSMIIPSLEIGQSTVLQFEWDVPNPDDYAGINDNPWHFCLLARIESLDDPMTVPEVEAITENVKNNNNIAWKNMTVVDIFPDVPSPVSAAVAVGNPYDVTHSFTLEFVKEENEPGSALYDEAEITITLDNILLNAWTNGGSASTNLQGTPQNNVIIVENNHALIENLQFIPNEIGTLSISFNFLIDELTDKEEYIYHLIQRDAVTGEVIGGETFEVRKHSSYSFAADAGGDEEIDKNQTITLTANTINQPAVYNWYDPEGNLIHTGTDLTVTPDITMTYQLEVISSLDGFKDYDEVQITVNPYKIESLVPNPTTSQVTISYLAEDASSAYLMIVDTNTGSSDNYILDTQASSVVIDVSALASGLYDIILVCDGDIQNSKTLLKQ